MTSNLHHPPWPAAFSNWLPSLLTILAIACIPLTLMILSQVEKTMIEEHGQYLASTAESLTQRLDRILFERYGDLKILSQSTVLRNEDELAMTQYLNNVQRAYQAFAWIGVVDANGTVLAATTPSTVGQSIALYPIIENIRRQHNAQTQDAAPIPFLNNSLGVMYGAPIQPQAQDLGSTDTFERMVIFCLSVAYLAQEFDAQASTYREHYLKSTQIEWHLIRNDGLVLVDSMLGEEGTANLRALALPSALVGNSSQHGYLLERHRRRNIDVLTGYARTEGLLDFPGFSWRVLFRRELNEITTEVRDLQVKLGASSLVVLGPLFGLLIWSTARNRTNQEQLRASAKSLQKSDAKFRAIVENAPSGIALVDDQGTIILTNKLLLTQFGYEKSELREAHIERLLPNQLRTLHRNDRIEPSATRHFFGNEGSHKGYGLKKTGSHFSLEIEATLLTTVDGNLMLLSIIDVTERTKIQTERERIIAELEQKNLELERFTYTASHDLKSPLVTIRGFLDSIDRDLTVKRYDRLPKDLTRVEKAAKTMERLLDDLLEFSRVGRRLNPPGPVNFGTFAKDIFELLNLTQHKTSIDMTIDPNFPEITGDPLRLYQLMQNLIENAIKFMGNQTHPRIRIGFREGHDQTVFFIQDNGLGIDPSYQKKVFGLFERLNEQIPGTGVGLALVQRIVESYHGEVWVESDGLGHGSTFAFTLHERDPHEEKKDAHTRSSQKSLSHIVS